MGRAKQTAAQVRYHLAQQLDWQWAERNDRAVAQALRAGEPIDAMHTLDEAGLLDRFFVFLQQAKILEHWQRFEIEKVRRVFLPAIYFVLLYGVRILLGISSSNALPRLLFSNIAVMSLIGFNATAVSQGMTKRGASRRTGEREYNLMDPATLATTICKASAKALENLFNGSIRCLAAFGIFRSELMVAVDGTPVETTANYSGCGCQKRIKYKLSAEGKRVKVVEWVYGWRLIALVDLVTLIPLAIKIVQIQDHEAPHLLALVAQAQKNLQPYSRIVQIVIDRAYVDGSTLYQLDSSGLTFVVIAKSNMVAYTTARELAVKAKRYERVLLVTHSQGRHSWSSELVTTVTPVTGIRTWANYRPPKTPGKRRPRLRPQDRRAQNGCSDQFLA